MALPTRRQFTTPFIPHEVSAESSDSMRLAYEQYSDERDPRTRDPFDILAEIEEERGEPLYFS